MIQSLNKNLISITIAKGDGIGPEIMDHVLEILKAANAPLNIETIEIGEKCYKAGYKEGISPNDLEKLQTTHAFLKGPTITPAGNDYKNLSTKLRRALSLSLNIRPCQSFAPFVATKHPKMDLVIIRETKEDLYTHTEYRQTPGATHAIKLISEQGCEKIIRYAFDYARIHNRKKVSCFTKQSLLPITDGLFAQTFTRLAQDYPSLQTELLEVDEGSALLADAPEQFDVIVLPGLYGGILSEITAQFTGSSAMVGSANIGKTSALFEALHGACPKYVGKDEANPSGLLQAAILMLLHLGLYEIADKIQNSWLYTLEQGLHPSDIYKEGVSKKRASCSEFVQKICENLGKRPKFLEKVDFSHHEKIIAVHPPKIGEAKRELIGVDCFIYSEQTSSAFVKQMQSVSFPDLKLCQITNRGSEFFPKGDQVAVCIDQWRVRFTAANDSSLSQKQIIALLSLLTEQGIDLIRTENLYTFDGERGFTP